MLPVNNADLVGSVQEKFLTFSERSINYILIWLKREMQNNPGALFQGRHFSPERNLLNLPKWGKTSNFFPHLSKQRSAARSKKTPELKKLLFVGKKWKLLIFLEISFEAKISARQKFSWSSSWCRTELWPNVAKTWATTKTSKQGIKM